MGTLQTELEKALADWDKQDEVLTLEVKEKPMKHSLFTESVGTSRATFNMVVANPGMTRSQVLSKLEAAGFKKQSATSILSAYLRTGVFVERNGGAIFSTTSTYVSSARGLTAARAKKAKDIPPKVVKAPEPIKGVVSHTAATPSVPVPVHYAPSNFSNFSNFSNLSNTLTAEYVMDHISIAEGKKLFTLLSNVF